MGDLGIPIRSGHRDRVRVAGPGAIAVVCGVVALLLSTPGTGAGQILDENLWVPNGTLYAVARDGGTIHIGEASTTWAPPRVVGPLSMPIAAPRICPARWSTEVSTPRSPTETGAGSWAGASPPCAASLARTSPISTPLGT